jgi:hypothetical protein
MFQLGGPEQEPSGQGGKNSARLGKNNVYKNLVSLHPRFEYGVASSHHRQSMRPLSLKHLQEPLRNQAPLQSSPTPTCAFTWWLRLGHRPHFRATLKLHVVPKLRIELPSSGSLHCLVKPQCCCWPRCVLLLSSHERQTLPP